MLKYKKNTILQIHKTHETKSEDRFQTLEKFQLRIATEISVD